jgi:hypothetical protein
MSEPIAVADANVIADTGDDIKVILAMNDCGLRSDLLDEVLSCFREDGPAIDAAIGERLIDPCFGPKLFERQLNLSAEFGAAQQLPHVGSRHFVMNLDDAATGLVFDKKGSGFVPLNISVSTTVERVNSRR